MNKRILSVQDVSCFGKCSNTVALPVVSAAGMECVILPTALLSTHTGGFEGFTFLDLSEEMEKILRHWETLSLRFDAVLTGYFAGAGELETLKRYLERNPDSGRSLYVDPVMGDNGKLYGIYDESFVEAMRAFVRGADIITPNVTEACLLCGAAYEGDSCPEPKQQELLSGFRRLGVKRAVITGARFRTGETGVIAADLESGCTGVFRTPYADCYLHGTGDTFASSLCAYLQSGAPLMTAAQSAMNFTYACIKNTLRTDERYGLLFEPELESLAASCRELRSVYCGNSGKR